MFKFKKTSVSEATEYVLNSNPFLNDLFAVGAVNYSGLARHMMPQIKQELGRDDITLEAVVMAIRRYVRNSKLKGVSEDIRSLVADFSLTMKNNMIDVTLSRTHGNYSVVSKAYREIDWGKGERMYIFNSVSEIGVLTDRKNSRSILSGVKKHDIVGKHDKLVAIIIKAAPRMVEVPGILYHLCSLIAREGIPLVDLVSTSTEIIFAVRETDGLRVYELLDKAIKEAGN